MSDAPVDTVLFDLDDTLVTYRQTPAEVLEAAFDDVGVDPLFSIEDYYARYDRHLREEDSIKAIWRESFAAAAAANGHDPELGRAVAASFDDIRDPTAVDLLPGAADALDALAATHRIGLVTNGPPDVQRPKMEAVGLDRWLDAAVFAGYDTEPKPDPEPFDRALSALDARPEGSVHVGNSLRSDVAGAHAAGIQSVWIPAWEEDQTVEPHYRIDSIGDLRRPPWV
jgi:putative hydrolase of the HAD superfamily